MILVVELLVCCKVLMDVVIWLVVIVWLLLIKFVCLVWLVLMKLCWFWLFCIKCLLFWIVLIWVFDCWLCWFWMGCLSFFFLKSCVEVLFLIKVVVVISINNVYFLRVVVRCWWGRFLCLFWVSLILVVIVIIRLVCMLIWCWNRIGLVELWVVIY